MSSAEPKAPIAGIGRYMVGTVARLTGLSPHLIRAWERRYAAVQPQRSRAGTRLYSDRDVARLQLLKGLVDLGESVSRIAGLSTPDLRARLAQRAEPGGVHEREETSEYPRLALLCPTLSAQIASNPAALGGVRVVSDRIDFEPFRESLAEGDPDVLVVALEALPGDVLQSLARCREAVPEADVYVVYHFARRGLLEALADRDIRLARAPLRLSLLRRMLFDTRQIRRARALREAVDALPVPTLPSVPAPASRIGDAQLSELLELRTSVACECPSQLAQLVQALLAFERYSERCMSEQPRDAELHELLARGTGHARGVVEGLLLRVCEHDGIPLILRDEEPNSSRAGT